MNLLNTKLVSIAYIVEISFMTEPMYESLPELTKVVKSALVKCNIYFQTSSILKKETGSTT